MRDGHEKLEVGCPIVEAGRLEGDKMLAEQPRPHNLIPIIGFPGEFLVMFEAEKTSEVSNNH